ncbi:MAG: outer membrane protein transport protein [Myxococcales bacterium]|nr:outer membrane protein transport protein [Myxococcales bacterium]
MLAALLLPASSLAGGFAVSEQDAAASGRMGTAVARPGSASSVHFNPAGLGELRGASALAGVTAIIPTATAGDPANGPSFSSSPSLRTPPHAYAALSVGPAAVGVGFNAPFGGGLRWPEGWRGRYELVEMKLEVLAGHLAAAYRVTDQLSLGAGASLYRVGVMLDKRVDLVDRDGRALLGGSGVGLGGGLGLQYAPSPGARLGLAARLPSSVGLSGGAHFEGVPPSFNQVLIDQPVSTSVALPAKLAAGAELQLAPVRLFADVEYTFWSSFQSFEVDFSDERTPDVSQPRNWANAVTVRLGAERDFGLTTARAGLLFDGAASPAETLSPSLPDSVRLGLSVGAGRDIGPVRADLAYQFISFLPRESSGDAFPAQYAASAHLLALSMSWSSQGL